MKRACFVVTLLSATLLPAQTTFYNQGWNSSSLSTYWSIAAGSPSVLAGWLENTTGSLGKTRVLYSGVPPTQDYSVTTSVNCPTWTDNSQLWSYHYLRASSTAWYEVQFYCTNGGLGVMIALYNSGYY